MIITNVNKMDKGIKIISIQLYCITFHRGVSVNSKKSILLMCSTGGLQTALKLSSDFHYLVKKKKKAKDDITPSSDSLLSLKVSYLATDFISNTIIKKRNDTDKNNGLY